MKLKLILQSLFAVGLLAAAGALYLANNNLKTEVAQLRATNEELKQAAATAEETHATQTQVAGEELVRLRKDNDELLRLRNDVRQLREDKQQLSRQVQTAQTQFQNAQAQVQELRLSAAAAPVAAPPVAGQPPQPGYPPVSTAALNQAKANACLNNLRQIDGAKQQWALEKQKPANAVVTEADLAPYLKDNKIPVCPAGGAYTLNGLEAFPACSLPGHALPR